MDLHETRKEQRVEVANYEHVKGAGEWPIGGAGRPRRGRPAWACGHPWWPFLHRFRLGLFCSSEDVLVIFLKISSRPAWFKPPGLLFL